jgi:2-phosphoglycolate phosphatase
MRKKGTPVKQYLRAIILDLDGTLIDSTDAIVASMTHAFAADGATPPTREAIIGTISLPLERQIAALDPQRLDERVALYRAHYAETAAAITTLLPGVLEFLALCRGAGVGLGFATSKRRTAAEALLEHLNVLEYFASRVGPEDVKNPKPAPDPLLLAAEQLGVQTADCVYVGDSPIDAAAARAAGMPCVLVTTGYVDAAALKPEGFPVYTGLADAGAWLREGMLKAAWPRV